MEFRIVKSVMSCFFVLSIFRASMTEDFVFSNIDPRPSEFHAQVGPSFQVI